MNEFSARLREASLEARNGPSDLRYVKLTPEETDAIADLWEVVQEVMALPLQPPHDETEWSDEDLAGWGERENIQNLLRPALLAFEGKEC